MIGAYSRKTAATGRCCFCELLNFVHDEASPLDGKQLPGSSNCILTVQVWRIRFIVFDDGVLIENTLVDDFSRDKFMFDILARIVL